MKKGGTGGGNTITGLIYEAKVDLGTFLNRQQDYKVDGFDVFYKEKPDALEWVKVGCIGIEMESYALYLNAARAGKRALSINAVSDNIVNHLELSAEDRAKSVDDTIIFSLETAISLD